MKATARLAALVFSFLQLSIPVHSFVSRQDMAAALCGRSLRAFVCEEIFEL